MVDKTEIFRNINQGILDERYSAFQRNLEKNMGCIEKFGGLSRLVPMFREKNVIVAGAGPSIDSDLQLLKKYQQRDEIIIISTDMALLPLVKRGILPKYVISCETVPVDYFSGIPTEKMHLLAFSCISNSNLRKWKGDISFYNWMVSGPLYDKLWKRAGDLGAVATGSIVTTQAVSFALGCNISSLMVAGNDLAFKGEYYMRDTVISTRNLNSCSRFMPVQTAEFNTIWKRREFRINRGNSFYYSNNQFLAAKMWLEDLFKGINIPIFDSSVPGCSEKCVNKTGLNDYFSRFERRSRKKRR